MAKVKVRKKAKKKASKKTQEYEAKVVIKIERTRQRVQVLMRGREIISFSVKADGDQVPAQAVNLRYTPYPGRVGE